MTEKVKYAPKAVIEELDALVGIDMVYDLYEEGGILSENDNVIYDWAHSAASVEGVAEGEIAIINHVFGTERLQQEREPRYYVEVIGNDTDYIRKGTAFPVSITYVKPEYSNGLDHDTAVKAQALYGGTIEEIK